MKILDVLGPDKGSGYPLQAIIYQLYLLNMEAIQMISNHIKVLIIKLLKIIQVLIIIILKVLFYKKILFTIQILLVMMLYRKVLIL